MRRFLVLALAVGLTARVAAAQVTAPAGAPPTPAAPGTMPAARGVIRGSVVGEGGQPIAAASVTVRGARDSVLVTGVLTGPDGRFRVSGLAPGRYVVRVAQLGYRPRSAPPVTLSATAATADLGVLRLEAAPVELKEVEVTAARAPVVVAADRTIYNTKAMPVASSGTAVDVLRSVPELEVDQDGKVTMHGNQSVAIHFNGRPAPIQGQALQQYLQHLPASRIDRIEVVPNPSARYDPEGMGGIVNIAFKDNADLGLSGTLTGTASTRGQTGVIPRVAYQKGALTFFGGLYLLMYRMNGTSHDLRENLLAQPIDYLDLSSATKTNARYVYGDFSTEYKLSKTLTGWANFNGAPYWVDADADLSYLWLDSAQAPARRSDRVTQSDGTTTMASLSTGIRRQLQPQRNEWSLELRRSGNHDDTDGRWTEQPLNLDGTTGAPGSLTLNEAGADYTDWTLQADLTRPVHKGKVEAGAQGTRRRDGNDNTMRLFGVLTDPDPASTTVTGYLLSEDLASGYVTASQPFGKLSVQAGLRAERAHRSFDVKRTGDSFVNDYHSLFPSGNVALDLGKGRSIRLAYSKRLERPYAFYLNPDVPSSDPLNRTVGNPYLKPRYTHSVSADLMWMRSEITWRLSPYFRRTTNDWAQIKNVDSAGVSTITYANVNAVNSAGVSTTVSLRQTRRLGGYLNGSVYSNRYSAGGLGPDAYAGRHLRFSLTSNAQYRISSALGAQLMAMYYPPRDLPSGTVSGIFYSYAGLRQKLGKSTTLSVSAMDPLGLYQYKVTTRNGSHAQTSTSSYRLRSLTVNLTYTFGKPPQSARPQRTDDAQQPQPQQQPDRQVR